MKKIFLILLFLLSVLFLIGCSSDNKEIICNEYEYWEEVSAENPYPGMKCDSGPTKTIGINFFFTEGSEDEQESQIEAGMKKLNNAFGPHGILFELDKVYNVRSYPENKENFDSVFEGNHDPSNHNVVIKISGGNGCSHPWADFGNSAGLQSCKVNRINPEGYDALVHETGHFMGLLHTHWQGNNEDDKEWNLRGITWVDPVKNCNKEGDYICSTNFDCYTQCQEQIGCRWIRQSIDKKTPKKTSEKNNEFVVCGEDYNPPLDNAMSYYHAKIPPIFTKEQGARARYYLMYRLSHLVDGGQLKEFFKP